MKENQTNGLTIGFDIGVSSAGWGVINEYGDIVKAGVSLFEENTKDANVNRRNFRGSKRPKRRKKHRKTRAINLLKKEGIYEWNPKIDPYKTRKKGLTHKLSNPELTRAILHLMKFRGVFFEIQDGEDGKIKSIVNENKEQMNKNSLFPCEVQIERFKKEGMIRGSKNYFENTAFKSELETILENQKIASETKKRLLDMISEKRHYGDGPGDYNNPSEYGKYQKQSDGTIKEINLIEKMRGFCSVFEKEKRAPKICPSVEIFNFLEILNNLKIEQKKLTREQKNIALNHLETNGFFAKTDTAQPNALARLLGVKKEEITGFPSKEKNKKQYIPKFKAIPLFLELWGKEYKHDNTLFDQISELLTSEKNILERERKLKDIGLHGKIIEKLKEETLFKGYHALSFKAIHLFTSEMLETTENHMQVKQRLGQLKANKKLTLETNAILNPVVKRSVNQVFKIYEELEDEYGIFQSIGIETTRAKNSLEQKQNYKKYQEINEKKNKAVTELITQKAGEEYALRANATTKLKVKLYLEQDGKCIYSGNPLNLESIINQKDHYEIEHIIPFSISLDDSQNNKVLSEHEANQIKDNQSPFQYFNSGRSYGKIKTFDNFKKIVNSNPKFSKKKKQLLLLEREITKEEVRKGFVARNLIDTSYASVEVLNAFKSYFKGTKKATKVHTVKGKMTHVFRKVGINESFKWNIPRETNVFLKERSDLKHHAIDALIIANIIKTQFISTLLELDGNKTIVSETGEIILGELKNQELFKRMKKLAFISDEKISVSRRVSKKTNAPLTNQTLYVSKIKDGKERKIKRTSNIYEMKSEDIEKVFFKYEPLMKEKDPKTFEELLKIYKQYKGETKPFAKYAEENKKIRKFPHKDKNPLVKKIKYYENVVSNCFDVTHKYPKTQNGKKIFYTDISKEKAVIYFSKKKGYRIIPVAYVDYDFNKEGKKINAEKIKAKKKIAGVDASFKEVGVLYRYTRFKIFKGDEVLEGYYLGAPDNKLQRFAWQKLDLEKGKPFTMKKATKVILIETNILGKEFHKEC